MDFFKQKETLLTAFILAGMVFSLENGILWSLLVGSCYLSYNLWRKLEKQKEEHDKSAASIKEGYLKKMQFALEGITSLKDPEHVSMVLSKELKPLEKHLYQLVKSNNTKEERAYEILDNLQQAVCSFGSDFLIDDDYSPFCKTLFEEEKPQGSDALTFLFGKTNLTSEALASMKFQLGGVFGMAKLQWKISSPSFVQEAMLKVGRKRLHLRFQYFPHYNEKGALAKISVVTGDITSIKSAEQEASRKQREMEKIFALLEVPDGIFEQYMDETSKLFERIKADVKALRGVDLEGDGEDYLPIVTRMFRDVHTIKGNSRLFNFNFIQNVSHDVESYLARLKEKEEKFTKKSVMILTEKLMEINEEIYSYTSLRRDILGRGEKEQELAMRYRIQWAKSLLHQFSIHLREAHYDLEETGKIQWELNRALASFHRSSLLDYVVRYDKMIQDLGQELGKSFAPIAYDLDYRYFDNEVLGTINDIIVHCIRNSCDHGIEDPESRMEKGKAKEGQVRVCSYEENGVIVITVSDDGRGIEPDKVAEKASTLGVLSQTEKGTMSDEEKMELIFHPGLSTKQNVTEVSGRGVGLDAVKSAIKELSGTIKVTSKKDQGTTFTIKVPDKREEFLSRFAMVDIKSFLTEYWEKFSPFAKLTQLKLQIKLLEDEESQQKTFFALADKKCLLEILRLVFLEAADVLGAGGEILCELEALDGRRSVDSASFYRVRFSFEQEGRSLALNPDSSHLEEAASLASYHSSTLMVRSKEAIELNVPSLMPYDFAAEKIPVVCLVEEDASLKDMLASFFGTTLHGWPYELLTSLEDLDSCQDRWVMAVCCEKTMESFVKKRGSRVADDGIILFAAHTEGFDATLLVDIMPPSVRFVPAKVKKRSFHQVLEALILSRFISLMKKQHHLPETSNIYQETKRTA